MNLLRVGRVEVIFIYTDVAFPVGIFPLALSASLKYLRMRVFSSIESRGFLVLGVLNCLVFVRPLVWFVWFFGSSFIVSVVSTDTAVWGCSRLLQQFESSSYIRSLKTPQNL